MVSPTSILSPTASAPLWRSTPITPRIRKSPRSSSAARRAAPHDGAGTPLVHRPEREVGGEREGVADAQVRARPGLLEAIPREHAPLRGADELHVKGPAGLRQRGQPYRDGRAP